MQINSKKHQYNHLRLLYINAGIQIQHIVCQLTKKLKVTL